MDPNPPLQPSQYPVYNQSPVANTNTVPIHQTSVGRRAVGPRKAVGQRSVSTPDHAHQRNNASGSFTNPINGASPGLTTNRSSVASFSTLASNGQTSEGLPEGWTREVTPDGRPYYTNHATKATTWTKPELIPSPLLPGWEERKTPDGKVYYCYLPTQGTQWERPSAPVVDVSQEKIVVPQMPQLPVASQEKMVASPSPSFSQPTTMASPNPTFSQQKIVASPRHVSAIPVSQVQQPAQSSLPPLPLYWEERRTGDGKVYYCNTQLQTTQWHRPSIPVQQPTQPQPLAFVNPIQSQPQQQQRPVSVAPLVLQQRVNPGVQPHHGRSQSQQPTQAAPMARPQQAAQTMNIVPTLQHPVQTSIAQQRVPAANPLPTIQQGQTMSVLPPGWEQRRTIDGRIYYCNVPAQTTQWFRPQEIQVVQTQVQVQQPQTQQMQPQAQQSQSQARLQTQGQFQPQPNQKPVPVKRQAMPVQSQINMQNPQQAQPQINTQQPQQFQPQMPVQGQLPIQSQMRVQQVPNQPQMYAQQPQQPIPMQSPAVASPLQPQPMQAAQVASPLAAPAALWEVRATTQGDPYFYNTQTKVKTWELPPQTNGYFGVIPAEKLVPEHLIIPEVTPLPAGWEERKTADGKVYYCNVPAQTTHWDRPVGVPLTPSLTGRTSTSSTSTTPFTPADSQQLKKDRRKSTFSISGMTSSKPMSKIRLPAGGSMLKSTKSGMANAGKMIKDNKKLIAGVAASAGLASMLLRETIGIDLGGFEGLLEGAGEDGGGDEGGGEEECAPAEEPVAQEPAPQEQQYAPVEQQQYEPAPYESYEQAPMEQQYEPAPMEQAYEPAPMEQQYEQAYEPAPMEQQYEPAPMEQAYEPAPMEQQYEPAPMEQAYEPAPMEQAYEPAPMEQAYEPAPVEQAYEPAPVEQAYEPAPEDQYQSQPPVEESYPAEEPIQEPTEPIYTEEPPPQEEYAPAPTEEQPPQETAPAEEIDSDAQSNAESAAEDAQEDLEEAQEEAPPGAAGGYGGEEYGGEEYGGEGYGEQTYTDPDALLAQQLMEDQGQMNSLALIDGSEPVTVEGAEYDAASSARSNANVNALI